MSYQNLFGRVLYPLQNYTASDYVPQPYVIPGEVEAVHDWPRFGNPNDFNDLIASVEGGDTKEEAKKYAMGIFAGAILILSIAVLWFFCLAMLKIAGPNKVGFFAGRLERPTSEAAPEESGFEVVTDEHATAPTPQTDKVRKSFNRRVIIVRAVFAFFGFITMVAGVLFYTKGVSAFKSSINEIYEGIELIQNVAYDAINVTDGVILADEQLDAEIEPQVASGDPLCRIENDGITSQIRQTWADLVSGVADLEKLVEENLLTVSDDLRKLIEITEEVESNLDTVNIVFYILLIISIFIICFIAVMLVGVLFAAAGISNGFTCCITNAVIWPIFTLLLVLAWILSLVFLITSLAGADFCMAPDTYVIELVDKYKGEFQSVIFAFVLFYVSGCTVKPSGEAVLVDIMEVAISINQYAHTLSQLIGNINPATVAAICGVSTTEAQTIQALSTFLHNISHVINRSINGVIDLLSCKSFNPIYTTFVHDALCSSGVQGLTWIFFTMLTVALSSMMMLTFRAALYPVKQDSGSLAAKDGAVEVFKYEPQADVHDDGRVEDADVRASQDENDQKQNVEIEALEADKAVQIY